MKIKHMGTSLAEQWIRLCAPNAAGPGSIPARGTKILQATRRSQKKKKKKITLTCVTTIKLTTEFSTEIMEIHTQWNTFSLMKVTTNVDFCGQ